MTFVGVGLIFVVGLIMLASGDSKGSSNAKKRSGTKRDGDNLGAEVVSEAIGAATSRAVAVVVHDAAHLELGDADDHDHDHDHDHDDHDWDDD